MEARRVIKLKKAPPSEEPSLIHSPKEMNNPRWFKLGAFKLIRIGNHVFEPASKKGDEVTYVGLYNDATEYVDTTAEEPEGEEEKAKAFLREDRK